MKNCNIAFTSDMWTDTHKQRPYLTITAHWINDEWEMQNRVICTEEFDASLKKTGLNIKTAISSALQSFGHGKMYFHH